MCKSIRYIQLIISLPQLIVSLPRKTTVQDTKSCPQCVGFCLCVVIGSCVMQEEPSSLNKTAEAAPQGFIPLILWGLRDEFKALKEGMAYACSPENRSNISCILCVKHVSFIEALRMTL